MPIDDARLIALVQRIIRTATASDEGARILEDCCATLLEAGLPLAWLSMATPALDPSLRGFNVTWRPGAGLVREPDRIGTESEAVFKLSPIHALLADGRRFARWRLDDSGILDGFPLLRELRASGITDYALHIVDFAPGTALVGVGIAVASDSDSGFSDADLALFGEVLPALALAVCKLNLSRTLRETLSVYLGPKTATRVLNGGIRRGEGETRSAAILLTDLRAFTALTDRDDPARVVGWLDEHFEALGEPVAQHGGEILKFLGDGFLAIFPVPDASSHPCAVCADAVTAAKLALARNRALNDRRRTSGLPQLDADLVLHFGRVVYGNVGTSRRLDFTVIGPAVNEASRIEKLCDTVGHRLLVSDSFAQRCERSFEPVGHFALRGLERSYRIWTLPDGES